ncbi:MAG: VOC family protein, partial [Nitrososphaerales archaeon]
MIKKISHIGIVVRNMDETLKLFERAFNLKPAVVKEAMDGKLKVAFIPVGDDEIELLQPLDLNIPLGEFLQTHGQGIHHISLATDDIES